MAQNVPVPYISKEKEFENSLVKFANEIFIEEGLLLDDYHKVEFYVHDSTVLTELLVMCKFKDKGNIYDYADIFKRPESLGGAGLAANFDLFQRLVISKKMESVGYYTTEGYGALKCIFLISFDYIKKFSKALRKIVLQDSKLNMFREVDFKCKEKEYLEISDDTLDSGKPVEVIRKKVKDENLVFDEKSTIVKVMKNIENFFQDETQKMYKQMEIVHKRAVILHGDPGNGKSAAIRELIRKLTKITKIVINPNVLNITRVLSSLMRELDGRKAIIIIEDIDSMITQKNRSEFLNILDGVDIKSGIYIIGTTNYLEKIDPAFANRPGRFDETYYIGNPSSNTRRIFFQSKRIDKLLEGHKIYRNKNKKVPVSQEETKYINGYMRNQSGYIVIHTVLPTTKIGKSNDVIELFVRNSEGLSMANLKEFMTATRYKLVINKDMSIEEAVQKTREELVGGKKKHSDMHNEYKKRKSQQLPQGYADESFEWSEF